MQLPEGIKPVHVIRNLGIPPDPSLNFYQRIKFHIKIALYYLHNMACHFSLVMMHKLCFMLSLCPVLTIVIPRLLAFLQILYKSFSVFRSLLRESSPITSSLLTSLIFSYCHTGYQFCPISNSKLYYLPSKLYMTLHPLASVNS